MYYATAGTTYGEFSHAARTVSRYQAGWILEHKLLVFGAGVEYRSQGPNMTRYAWNYGC
jgi:hypothetical protein